MVISRREVVAGAAALPFAATGSRAAGQVTATIDYNRGGGMIGRDYLGLGFEISSVAVPGLLSAKNHTYLRLVHNLGEKGVIRIGGNTSDFSRYDANGMAVSAPKATVVTEANLRELKTFVDAIGWKLIWGLNLGDDRLDNAVAEARAVANVMGDSLLALEAGNEPDLFGRAGHRPADYNYDAWLRDYRRYKAAIRAVLPHAPFAGPDLAGAADWMEKFARDETDIALLTAHHYITGQANPAATIDTILTNNTKYDPVLARFQVVAQAAGKLWRMCETASFSGGGKDGVSNTYAAALWALDYLFVLAEHDCAGVNMETGVNHLGWISNYTPIGDDLKGHYGAAPEYYGLLAFAQMPTGMVRPVTMDANGINLTAWTIPDIVKKETVVAIINKDARQDAEFTVNNIDVAGHDMTPNTKVTRGRVMRLTGPALNARDGVMLGGVSVAADGSWTGAKHEPVKVANGSATLHVPAASAALVWLGA